MADIKISELPAWSTDDVEPLYVIAKPPELSDWQCWLFGSTDGSGFIWRPEKGKEPNWFWRKMQYLFFGNRWVYKQPLDK